MCFLFDSCVETGWVSGTDEYVIGWCRVCYRGDSEHGLSHPSLTIWCVIWQLFEKKGWNPGCPAHNWTVNMAVTSSEEVSFGHKSVSFRSVNLVHKWCLRLFLIPSNLIMKVCEILSVFANWPLLVQSRWGGIFHFFISRNPSYRWCYKITIHKKGSHDRPTQQVWAISLLYIAYRIHFTVRPRKPHKPTHIVIWIHFCCIVLCTESNFQFFLVFRKKIKSS